MLHTVQHTINTHHLLAKQDHILVALSGGADSVALLFVLLILGKTHGWGVCAVHVNHCIRGTQADEDQDFVVDLCKANQVPLVVVRRDVPALASASKCSLEEAGRNARYACFEEVATDMGATKIALAHHKNDNAETMLMSFCRGTGLGGLGGIAYVRGHIIRPFLDVSRGQIEAYCAENNLAYKQDHTNTDATYTRNNVRLHLLPWIEDQLNPSLVDALHRTAILCREDNECLNEMAATAYGACGTTWAGITKVHVQTFLSFSPALQGRVVRLVIAEALQGLHNVSFEHVAQVLALTKKQTGKKICLPRGLMVELSYDNLLFYTQNQSIAPFCYTLHLDRFVFIPECNQSFYLTLNKNNIFSQNECTKTFSYDRMACDLAVRSIKTGDSIYIEKIGGHQKIKDYFTNQKYPGHTRNGVPLLAHGSDVLWVMDEQSWVSDHWTTQPSRHTIYLYIQEGNYERNGDNAHCERTD